MLRQQRGVLRVYLAQQPRPALGHKHRRVHRAHLAPHLDHVLARLGDLARLELVRDEAGADLGREGPDGGVGRVDTPLPEVVAGLGPPEVLEGD